MWMLDVCQLLACGQLEEYWIARRMELSEFVMDVVIYYFTEILAFPYFASVYLSVDKSMSVIILSPLFSHLLSFYSISIFLALPH